MYSLFILITKELFFSGIRLFRVILITLFGVLSLILFLPIILFLLGYEVNGNPEAVSELAVRKNNINECHRIISYGLFTPPTGDKRRACIRNYAELTKDPTVCALLMPSSYGISCVGGAENSQLPCNTELKANSVYWRDGEKENFVSVRECVTNKVKRTELGNQCCQVARIAFLKNEDDCSALKENTPVHDRCLYALAWKLKDADQCKGIMNENARSACEVQTKAIKDDPSICSGCTPPVEGVEQLR